MSIAEHSPVRLLEIELSESLPDLFAPSSHHAQTHILVRLHTRPIGRLRLGNSSWELRPSNYSRTIWTELAENIQAHLREDGLPAIRDLDEAGIQTETGLPRCLSARQQFLSCAPLASVVVPTRNRPRRISTCLESLLRQQYPRYEIIVVDSAPSTSETHDLIRDTYAADPRVDYIRTDRAGASRARNLGLLRAHGDIVAFLDDDVVVDPHWLTEMVRGFGAGPCVACVTGAVLPAKLDTSAQVWFEEFGGFFKGFDSQLFDMGDNRRSNALYPYLPGAFGTGASMAFRTMVLRAAGGFDETLGPSTPTRGGEDLAAFLQLVTRGYQLVYQATAISYHLHRSEYSDLRSTIYSYGIGLSALMVRHLVNNPREVRQVLRRLPGGLQYLLSPHSKKNAGKTRGYPRELIALELGGLFVGPFAYLLSRLQNA